MSASSSAASAEQDDRPIAFQYVLVVLVQVAVIAALAWMAAAFR